MHTETLSFVTLCTQQAHCKERRKKNAFPCSLLKDIKMKDVLIDTENA